MLVALSRVAWHRNDLSRAAEYLKRADDLARELGCPNIPTDGGWRWQGCQRPSTTGRPR